MHLVLFSAFIICLILSSLVMLHPWLFLHALTINLFLFLLLHHDSVSVQLNLAFPCMGKRPREAATQLKIGFQVKHRVFPPPLSTLSSSQSSRFFPSFMNIYEEVSIWSWCCVKNRSQIKIWPTSFPCCYFTSSFLFFLCRSAELSAMERTESLDFLIMLDVLPSTHTHADTMIVCLHQRAYLVIHTIQNRGFHITAWTSEKSVAMVT